MATWATPPRVIAHRGASAEAPENTLAAFRAALDAGAHAIEFDVHLSADGVPVVIHDGTLERTTNGGGLVSDRTLAELRGLDAGARFAPAFRGERIPVLDEVLALARAEPRLLLDVELKTYEHAYPGLVEAVADAVRAPDLRARVVVSSFNPGTVREAKSAGLRTAMIVVAEPTDADVATWGPASDAFGVWEGACTPRAAKRLHSAGKAVFAWTVDDAARARAVLDDGADGIITNDPRGILRALGR